MTISTYKILIVDDEAMTRDLISSVLSSKGHKCETAVDGAQALEMALANGFDAVITDIVMPEKDGITLTRELLTYCQKFLS
ncbi:MAG: response regulator [Nitrospirae bacterium]|nr:response regulator [Nitrospirota bacterium]MCL5978532.1 response regulator [Nitrospirota bacterium]